MAYVGRKPRQPLAVNFSLLGTATAQLVHIGSLPTPGLRDLLGVAPVQFSQMIILFFIA